MIVHEAQRLGPAMAGGLVAMIVVTALSLVGRALGLVRLSFGRVLGTVLAPDGPETRAVGWSLHFLNGAVLALVYRELFRRTSVPAGPKSGAAAGLLHSLLSLAALGLFPRLHPRPRQAGLRPAHPYAYGPLTIPGMLAGHALYGAIVGWFLRPE